VVLVGEDHKIQFVSRGEAGFEPQDAVGLDVSNFVAEAARDEHTNLLDSVFQTNEPAKQLTEIVNAEGVHQWYEGVMIPLVRNGRTAAVTIVTRNVTARRLAEQELEMLRSLVPVCSWCRKVRTEDGEWQALETYLERAGRSRVTHGMCPECERKMSQGADLDSA
jgi:PAS domain S-box-containing protein